jgi:peptidyl-prolyl cis-trans isomerase SurA
MKKVLSFSIIILLIGLVFTQCGKQDENIVVTVGDQTISSDEVRDIFKAKFPKKENYTDIELEKKKELLQPLIKKNLHISEAYALGFNEDKKFIRMLEDQKMKAMGSKYYEITIIDDLVSESEIEKVITRQGVELNASHILIGFKGSRRPAERTRDEATKLVNDIITELRAGADFGTTAIKYSEDPSAKRNKGSLGYFTWGRMVGPFQEAAWKLETGEISDPVETNFGFHIIKLEDRREIPNYRPDRSPKNIYRLKQMLAKTHADSARVRWVRHYSRLKKKYNYVIYDDSLKYVSNLIQEKIKAGKIIPGTFTSKQKEITFAEYDGDKITLGTLINRYSDQLADKFGKLKDERAMRSEIDRLSMNRLVMLAILEKEIDKLPEIVTTLKRFSDDQLNKLVEQKQVTQSINLADNEVKDYYEKNKNSFMKDATIEIWEVYVKDQKTAELVAKKAKTGSNFEELARIYSEDKSLKNKGGYLGFKKIGGRGAVSRAAHELGPGGKIGGPLKYRSGWSVYKTGSKEKETIMTFEEAQTRAKSKLKRELTTQAKTEWENKLKEEYTIRYDDDKLRAI